MYSYEIDQFLRERNFELTSEEYMELTPQKCNQISRLTYNTENNTFHLYTYDGYDWIFKVKRI